MARARIMGEKKNRFDTNYYNYYYQCEFNTVARMLLIIEQNTENLGFRILFGLVLHLGAPEYCGNAWHVPKKTPSNGHV